MDALLLEPTALAGVLRVSRRRREDERGFLARLYCRDTFAAHGAAFQVAQVNHTLTRRPGTVRGLHFQHPPHAESKLVTCVRGRVFDVAVDLRRGSPTFLRWHGAELSAEAGTALLVPPGCAHGFQCLEPDSELVYLHSAPWVAAAEGAAHPLDPRLAIAWPLPPAGLSARDAGHPLLDDTFEGIPT